MTHASGPRLLLLWATYLLIGCSVVKQENPETKVRDFLASFQADLNKPDTEILKKFRVRQSREAVLAALAILQNKDPFVVCNLLLANAQIIPGPAIIKVEIPVSFSVQDLDTEDGLAFRMDWWLTPTDDGFVITEFNGESFYQAFSTIKNRNQWQVQQKLAMQERLAAYETARQLENAYDSVIWYATYQQQHYFYVVDGPWANYFLGSDDENPGLSDTRMGLVNAQGETIIPLEYDLIGTLAFVQQDLVEVVRDGKFGYFHLGTRQLVVDAVYDLIIPYGRDDVWAIVRKDSTYGWLNPQFQYAEGFPTPQAEQWTHNFEYLKKTIRLEAGNQVFCEIPNPDYTGNGIVMPPSYLIATGIFNPIEGHIATTEVPLYGWIDYKETGGTFMEKITDNLRALVITIRQRYLEGREEFYTSNNLVFINDQQQVTGKASVFGDDVSMHAIDSTLLEVRTPHDYWFAEYEACEESNLHHHTYFSITANGIVEPLTSKRLFPQTQYVKLDSNYFIGHFEVFDAATDRMTTTNFLSVKTLTFMRDEILAAYGYHFPEAEKREHFKQIVDWYNPEYTSLDEIEIQLTEIDQHNLDFLNRVLTRMLNPVPAEVI